MSMLNSKDGPGEFLAALYDDISTRVAGCFVDDDRDAVEVAVHLRGYKHREWSKADGQRKVWLYVQVKVDGRLAHELELNRMHSAPASLNMLLRCYLCPASVGQSYGVTHKEPAENVKGAEQVEWLCRAVDEYLQASARTTFLLGRAV